MTDYITTIGHFSSHLELISPKIAKNCQQRVVISENRHFLCCHKPILVCEFCVIRTPWAPRVEFFFWDSLLFFQVTPVIAAKFLWNAGNRRNFVPNTGGFAFFFPLIRLYCRKISAKISTRVVCMFSWQLEDFGQFLTDRLFFIPFYCRSNTGLSRLKCRTVLHLGASKLIQTDKVSLIDTGTVELLEWNRSLVEAQNPIQGRLVWSDFSSICRYTYPQSLRIIYSS